MRLIGICGRSGCGKSVFCDIAREKGFYVIDCDKVYKEMVSQPSECLTEIETAFGSEVICNNALNRKVMADMVFSNPEKLSLLNEITHKYIIQRVNEILWELPENAIVFLDAPTLFESGIAHRCELIIGITASDEICLSRIIERDNLTKEQGKKRLKNQKSTEFIVENCDIIIYNETSLTNFEIAVNDVLTELSK